MKKILAFLFAIWLTPALAQIAQTGAGLAKPVSGAAFVGPADAIASPTACYSLRACASALRGTKVANVCNSTGGVDVGCADMLSDATTGDLVPATISLISCPGANCTVKTLYDQIGSNCSGPCDVTNATVANRPTLTTSCGALSKAFCMAFSGTQQLINATSSGTISQPITLAAVANRTSGSGAAGMVTAGNGSAGVEVVFDTGPIVAIYAGGAQPSLSVTTSAWHSVHGVFNGASSAVVLDGVSSTTGNAGSGTWALSTQVGVGTDSFSQLLAGFQVEALIYPIAFSAGQQTTMCHNQFAYWGTSVSC